MSGAAAEAAVKTIKNITLAGAVLGGREIQMPRAATYYELYGIHNPEKIQPHQRASGWEGIETRFGVALG